MSRTVAARVPILPFRYVVRMSKPAVVTAINEKKETMVRSSGKAGAETIAFNASNGGDLHHSLGIITFRILP